MKRILFLAPGMDGPDGSGRWNPAWPDRLAASIDRLRWKVVTPSLLLLASIAQEMGFETTICDEDFTDRPEGFYDIVCLYTVTPNIKRAYRYADQYRAEGSIVAMGGVHATLLPDEAQPHADALLLGEGEAIFPTFLADALRQRVKRRYTQEKGTIPLSHSPVPYFDGIPEQGRRLIPLQTARGCSHACRFCNVRSLYGKGLRTKGTKQIAAELEAVHRLKGVGRIYLTDDNIVSSPSHFWEILRAFRDSPFSFYANLDISFGQEEGPIREAYRSGLRQVLIGLESVTEQGLSGLDKDDFKLRHLAKYRDCIDRIQSCGIGVTGSFLLGQPGEDAASFQRLAEFLDQTPLFGVNITLCTPYPGTPLFHALNRSGEILSYDWNDYTIFYPVVQTAMPVDQLQQQYVQLLTQLTAEHNIQRRLAHFSDIYRRL